MTKIWVSLLLLAPSLGWTGQPLEQAADSQAAALSAAMDHELIKVNESSHRPKPNEDEIRGYLAGDDSAAAAAAYGTPTATGAPVLQRAIECTVDYMQNDKAEAVGGIRNSAFVSPAGRGSVAAEDEYIEVTARLSRNPGPNGKEFFYVSITLKSTGQTLKLHNDAQAAGSGAHLAASIWNFGVVKASDGTSQKADFAKCLCVVGDAVAK